MEVFGMNFKSAWVDEPRHIVIRQMELREPGPDEVTVRVKACGICGTDIHFFTDLPAKTLTPLGHEVAGVISVIGPGLTHLRIGMPVVVQNNIVCGACDACLNQKPASCSNIQTYMNDQAGMGEFLVVPSAMVIPFEGLDFPVAALAEPLTVALDLLREADVRMGDDVLIIGPGCIGLGCVFLSRKNGARRIVVVGHNLNNARGAYRKEVALRLGADAVVDSLDTMWKENLKLTYPALFNKVIVTSPPHTIVDGIVMAGFNSRIVFDGIDFKDDEISFHANDFHFAKKRLIASHAIPNWGFPLALELLKQNAILRTLLLTHTFHFDSLEEGFNVYTDTRAPVIKPVILFD